MNTDALENERFIPFNIIEHLISPSKNPFIGGYHLLCVHIKGENAVTMLYIANYSLEETMKRRGF